MKIHTLFFINILFIFLLNSCSYFDEEEDKILPGKGKEFLFLKTKFKKANKKVKILAPKTVESWKQQHQNVRNHLFHFKSNPKLKLLKRIKLGAPNFKTSYIPPPVFDENVIYYCDNEFYVYEVNRHRKNIVAFKTTT